MGERRLTGKPPVSKTGTEGSSPSAPAIKQGNKYMNKAINFFHESYIELKKSIWLTRQQMMQSTLFVFIVVGLVALYIAIIDLFLTKGLGLIIGG